MISSFQVLEKVGINGPYLNAVKEIYRDITSQIIVNGAKTEKVEISRGVRQGCPLSMLLYTISAIPVLEMIKDNNQIKGHTTKRNNNIKVQCYADDTTIIINKLREMKAVNEIYKRHSEASEAKINEDKTQIFRLGEK